MGTTSILDGFIGSHGYAYSSGNDNVTVVLYNKSGVEEDRVTDPNPASGKKTWRPCWIKGSAALPADFEGLAVIVSFGLAVHRRRVRMVIYAHQLCRVRRYP